MISPTRISMLVSIVALIALPSAASAAVPRTFVGIDSQDTFASAIAVDQSAATTNLSAQDAIGIHIHRQPFNWQTIETSKGRYTFTDYDRYMAKMAAHGMAVLPILFDAPKFHSAAGEQLSKGIIARPKSGTALGAFARAVVERYGPQGTFWNGRPASERQNSAIRALQIWNEPNLRFYWSGKPNAKQYVALLKGAFQGIRGARGGKGVEVVTAGIPQSNTGGAIGLTKFLTQMYKAGAKKWMDTVGLNAYAKNAKDLGGKLNDVRGVMRKRGDAKAGLWVTEIGWADSGKKTGAGKFLVKGAAGQAREITNSIALLKKRRKSQRIRGFIYYQWRDQPPYREGLDPGTWGLHAGLLKKDGTRKRAYEAFRKAVAKL